MDHSASATVLITDEFRKAIDLIEAGTSPVFISGKAGTGKSTLLRHLLCTTKKNVVVVAPTGIAALQIGAPTIHSFFGLPRTIIDTASLKTTQEKEEVFRSLELLVIDECSMVRADVMEAIDLLLRRARNQKHVPFGGAQLILFGDLFQLPPVLSRVEADEYYDKFKGKYFFHSSAFEQVELKHIELTRVFRQEEEEEVELLEILNAIRERDFGNDEILERLNARVNKEDEPFGEGVEFITLTITNAQADKNNHERLEGLMQPLHSFKGRIVSLAGEPAETQRLHEFPAPKELQLKQDAQVMMVKNDRFRRWVNGSIGKIIELTKDSILVNIDGVVHAVETAEWDIVDYKYDKTLKRSIAEVIGKYVQYPMKLAWAITVHKSQGLSLDRVRVDLGQGTFDHGQAYVALSRCRELRGLFLSRPVDWYDVILDREILDYAAGVWPTMPPEAYRTRSIMLFPGKRPDHPQFLPNFARTRVRVRYHKSPKTDPSTNQPYEGYIIRTMDGLAFYMNAGRCLYCGLLVHIQDKGNNGYLFGADELAFDGVNMTGYAAGVQLPKYHK